MSKSSSSVGRPGFTLLEMMVVVIIISVVLGALLYRFQGAVTQGYRLEMMSELSAYAMAQERYKGIAQQPTYALLSELAAHQGFQLAAPLVVEHEEAQAGRFYLRVRHRKGSEVCEINYDRAAGRSARRPRCL